MNQDHCPYCAYDLSGSALTPGSVCPECGGAIDWKTLQRWNETTYRKKSRSFWIAFIAPWVGPVLSLSNHSNEFIEVASLALTLAAPIASICFLYRSLRLDRRLANDPSPRWLDAVFCFFAVAFYVVCVWLVAALIFGLR